MFCIPQFLSITILAAVLAAPPTSNRTGASTFREDADGLSVFADGYVQVAYWCLTGPFAVSELLVEAAADIVSNRR